MVAEPPAHHRAVPKGWDKAVYVVADDIAIRALFYPDGEVGIEHVCHRQRDGLTIINAPRLQLDGGHTIVSREPLTITPSVGCSDCGLHGFITDGRWLSC